MAKQGGWKQSANMVKTRSYKTGPDTVRDEAPGFGTKGPQYMPSYEAVYKKQASRAGGKSRGVGGSTDHAKGYAQAEGLNKMGSNRF